MRPKHNLPLIPKEKSRDAFENCKLDRKVYAENLTNIVNFYSDGFVLAINNKWGTGKTTFIKMWQQHLINNDFETIYFNAWENDFQSEVLLVLLAELNEIRGENNEEKFKSVLKKAKPLLGKLGLSVVKGVSKKVGMDEALELLLTGVAEVTLNGLEKEIENYTNRKNSIKEFKKALGILVNKISNEKPLIFIIDELDRCRPNYAVEVLEQIKHLFSVSGIVFVLAIDKIQLGYAIKGYYGNDNIDDKEYLRRFIDIEFAIPEPPLDKFVNHLFEYYKFHEFFDTRNIHQNFKYERQNFKDIYIALFSNKITSLRVHEKMFSHIKIILNTFSENQYSLPEILVILLFIKDYYTEIYNGIINKEYNSQQLLDELCLVFDKRTDKKEKDNIAFAVGRLIYCYVNYLGHETVDDIFEDKSKNKIKLNFKLSDNQFKRSFKYLQSNFDLDLMSLDPLLQKVNLLEKLKFK